MDFNGHLNWIQKVTSMDKVRVTLVNRVLWLRKYCLQIADHWLYCGLQRVPRFMIHVIFQRFLEYKIIFRFNDKTMFNVFVSELILL